jgi:hypothetical protein
MSAIVLSLTSPCAVTLVSALRPALPMSSETLAFGGNFQTSDFAFGSDGHHGTAITFV